MDHYQIKSKLTMTEILSSILVLGNVLLYFACSNPENQTGGDKLYRHLDSLYQHHQYFALREAVKEHKDELSQINALILEAKLDAVFNHRDLSNSKIDRIFKEYEKQLPDSFKIPLLEIKVTNSILLNDYKAALETTNTILKFDHILSQEKEEDLQNDIIIYRELKDSPKQKVSIKESTLPISKDKAGLSRISVSLGNHVLDAIFDTGANYSVITDSLAEKCGLNIFPGVFKVLSLSGQQIDSRIAVADSLIIGKSLVENIVFLVFPKESLNFSQIQYQIDLIVGFPVIYGLKEVRIVKDSLLNIPKINAVHERQNLALKVLTPVVEVIKGNKSLPFTFDTGATSTLLDKDYFDLYAREVEQAGVKDSIHLGGAGGFKKANIYKSEFSGRIANQPFQLDSVQIYFDTDIISHKGILGNLGQDVLMQYDTLIINFDKMFLNVK